MAVSIEGKGEEQHVVSLYGQTITFPKGFIGCESWQHFVLEDETGDGYVLTLRCLDQPGISFWVTDPFNLLPGYEVPIEENDAQDIALADLSDAYVLCILTVRPEPTGITANLLGPLVINVRERLGTQLVLSNGKYSVRHPVSQES